MFANLDGVGFLRCRAEKNRIFSQRRKAITFVMALRQQARRNAGQRENVDAQYLQQLFVAGQFGLHLNDGRRYDNFGVLQDLLQ